MDKSRVLVGQNKPISPCFLSFLQNHCPAARDQASGGGEQIYIILSIDLGFYWDNRIRPRPNPVKGSRAYSDLESCAATSDQQ